MSIHHNPQDREGDAPTLDPEQEAKDSDVSQPVGPAPPPDVFHDGFGAINGK